MTASIQPQPATRSDGEAPLVEVRDLKMYFAITRGVVVQRTVGLGAGRRRHLA